MRLGQSLMGAYGTFPSRRRGCECQEGSAARLCGLPASASKPCTGKVFTVEMPHQHVHRNCLGDIGPVKHQGSGHVQHMPQSGDVMLPVRQIHKQIVDVGVQEQGIVRAVLEVLVVERIEEQK